MYDGCAHLVAVIASKVSICEAVRAAFLSVDRGIFVPRYYERQGSDWHLQDAANAVYEDKALTTQVDENGVPSSSSSQPSIMAAMLEALDLRSGQRVLEIGTGTGYNAALIAHIVGAEGVVTLDIDPALCGDAVDHLAEAGYAGVCVQCCDGLQGYADMALYDRIIATASYTSVPYTWIEQLAPGGILVMNLVDRAGFVSVLLRLIKREDGRMLGTTLPTSARFMELRPSAPTDRSWMAEVISLDDTEPIAALADLCQQLRQNHKLIFFLSTTIPELCLRLQYRDGSPRQSFDSYDVLYCSETFLLAARSDRVLARGNVKLLLEQCQRWEQLGKPDLGCYQVEVDAEGHHRFQLRDAMLLHY